MIRKADWFKNVLAEGHWKLSKNPVHGHGLMQSRLATHQETGERAYMKPGFPSTLNTPVEDYLQPLLKPSALALERVISHLAFLLDMKIPPALLGFHPEYPDLPVCFSLEAGTIRFNWENVTSDNPTGIQAKALKYLNTHLLTTALNVWVEAADRKDAHIHYAEDKEGKALGIFNVDYGACTIFFRHWRQRIFNVPYYNIHNFRAVCPSVPGRPLTADDKKVVFEGVERIKKLSWEQTSKEVIGKIPEPFLNQEEKSLLIEGLGSRRDNIESLTNDWWQKISCNTEFHHSNPSTILC